MELNNCDSKCQKTIDDAMNTMAMDMMNNLF